MALKQKKSHPSHPPSLMSKEQSLSNSSLFEVIYKQFVYLRALVCFFTTIKAPLSMYH